MLRVIAPIVLAGFVIGCSTDAQTSTPNPSGEGKSAAHENLPSHTEKCEWCQGEFAKGDVVTKNGKITCKACAELH